MTKISVLLIALLAISNSTVLFNTAVTDTSIQTIPNTKLTTSTIIVKPKSDVSLAGSYRLRLPLYQMKIRQNILTINLCNTYSFNLMPSKTSTSPSPFANQTLVLTSGNFQTSPVASTSKKDAASVILKTIPIQLQLLGSTQMKCDELNQKLIIDLLASVDAVRLDGMLFFYKNQQILAKAQRKIPQYSNYSSINDTKYSGNWQFQFINLPLQVSNTQFSFQGCNNNVLSYKADKNGNISVKFVSSTQKACNVDTDKIFIDGIIRSKYYQIGEVSFKLYGKDGEKSAQGTPYLV